MDRESDCVTDRGTERERAGDRERTVRQREREVEREREREIYRKSDSCAILSCVLWLRISIAFCILLK